MASHTDTSRTGWAQITEASNYAGLSRKTLSRAANATGENPDFPHLPAKRVGGRLLFNYADIDTWLNKLPDA